MRALQRSLRSSLKEKIIPVGATAEFLLTENCVLLTTARPAVYGAIDDDEWVSLWSQGIHRQLKVDLELAAYATEEPRRMLAAKSANKPYRPVVHNDESLAESGQELALRALQNTFGLAKLGLSPLTCIRSTLDNPNAYGVKRPDYHIKEPLNGIGLSNWEIKSPWATETHKIEDIARVILSAITKVKADLSRNTPAGSPVKICLALSSNEASVFELTLHEGVFLAVEVGVWVIPTALQATQEGVGSQTRRYQPRLPGRARSSILPPETPGHAQ
ncbi:hypothetical protein HDU90_006677 [Geranomyces variabilis]|nr:hypothetical protein HDU90_006677 [Geranomyces variabilis]